MDSATVAPPVAPPATPPAPLSVLRWARRSPSAFWSRPIAIAAAGAGLIAAVMAVARPSRPPLQRPLPVAVVTARPVSGYITSRDYTGEVAAGRSSSLGFELPGTLERVLVEEGDRVRAGQPLARLDSRRLRAQRQQLLAQREVARAAVEEVRQQLTLAERQRDRRRQLHAQGAISREDLDQQIYGTGALGSRLVQAEAQVDDTEARLRQIDVDLARSVLVAPFDGTVGRRRLDEGVVVSGGQALLTLVESAPLELRVGVPPDAARDLQPGQRHPVRVGDRHLQATVSALLPELDAGSRTATVVLRLPVEDLPVGATARLSLRRSQTGAGFWLPTTALVAAERGLWSVYVLEEADAAPEQGRRVVRRLVEPLHTEGDRSLVRGTLRPGDRVIAAGTHRVVPGVRVTEAL